MHASDVTLAWHVAKIENVRIYRCSGRAGSARFEQAPVSQTRRCLFSTPSRNPFIYHHTTALGIRLSSTDTPHRHTLLPAQCRHSHLPVPVTSRQYFLYLRRGITTLAELTAV